MANEKEVIKRLLKIADNQQKIINKLAQAVGVDAEGLTTGPDGGGVEAGTDMAASIKASLRKIFPRMVVKNVEVLNQESTRPSLNMVAENTPSNNQLVPTLVEQFLLKNKILSSIVVNGKQIHKG